MIFKRKDEEEIIPIIKEVDFNSSSEFYLINRAVYNNYSDSNNTQNYLRIMIDDISINIKTIAIRNNGVFQELLTGANILLENKLKEMIENNQYKEIKELLGTSLIAKNLTPISKEDVAKILLDLKQNKYFDDAFKIEYYKEILNIIKNSKEKNMSIIKNKEEEYKKQEYAKENASEIIKEFIKTKD